MIIAGAIVVTIGFVQFWQREKWVRQSRVIAESFGLKALAAKPLETWIRWEIIGNIFFWVLGSVMIVIGIVVSANQG